MMKFKPIKLLQKGQEKNWNKKNKDEIKKIIYDKLRLNDKIEKKIKLL
jgi:hypothetical protein